MNILIENIDGTINTIYTFSTRWTLDKNERVWTHGGEYSVVCSIRSVFRPGQKYAEACGGNVNHDNILSCLKETHRLDQHELWVLSTFRWFQTPVGLICTAFRINRKPVKGQAAGNSRSSAVKTIAHAANKQRVHWTAEQEDGCDGGSFLPCVQTRGPQLPFIRLPESSFFAFNSTEATVLICSPSPGSERRFPHLFTCIYRKNSAHITGGKKMAVELRHTGSAVISQ